MAPFSQFSFMQATEKRAALGVEAAASAIHGGSASASRMGQN